MTSEAALSATLPRRIGFWGWQLDVLPWAQSRRLAAGIDELGYGSIWMPEATGREAMSHAALLLDATKRCVVATGIASIWARDATAARNASRTLSEAHPGRFVLGLGVSHRPMAQRRGATYARPLESMSQYLDAMADVRTRAPEPEREFVVLAALGPRMLELARDRTDGAHTYCVPVAHTRVARAALGDATLAVAQAVVVGQTRDHALRTAASHLEKYLALPNYRRNLERMGWTAAHMDATPVDEALVDALVAMGDADEVAERLVAHLDAGATHVMVQVLQDEPDVDGALRDLHAVREALEANGRWTT